MPSLDRYATPLRLSMSIDQFARLPQLHGYHASFADGHADLTYRPKLQRVRCAAREQEVRLPAHVVLEQADPATRFDALTRLFASAMTKVAPIDTMAATTRRHAVEAALRHTVTGGDGPFVADASVVAIDASTGKLLGAALITRIGLLPEARPEEAIPNPTNLPARIAVPEMFDHLTWLFVSPDHQRRGIATALVDRAIAVLAKRNAPALLSHVALDNPASMLFHWRYGFEVLPLAKQR